MAYLAKESTDGVGPKCAISLCVAIVLVTVGCDGREGDDDVGAGFAEEILYAGTEGGAPWAKFTGDIDGDGVPELLVGFHAARKLLSFSPGSQDPELILDGYAVLTDGAIADLNQDSLPDLLLPTERGLTIFYGPSWRADTIYPGRIHDVDVADLDDDGQDEIIARNQTAFGDSSGDVLVFRHDSGASGWTQERLTIDEGEGLAVADLDGDGDHDIVAGNLWFENQGASGWSRHVYAPDWTWPHVKVVVSDFSGDGRDDIALAPSEPEAEEYRLSWFERPDDPRSSWAEHVIVPGIESIVHSLVAGDMDLDGDDDLVYAEMHQGAGLDEVVYLENLGEGVSWRSHRLSNTGTHNLQSADWDNDGDLDLFGANWDGPDQRIRYWKNQRCDAPWSFWRRHVIDAERPGQAVFIGAADVDGDGFPEIGTGAYLYQNPGRSSATWERTKIDRDVVDIVLMSDLDGDDYTDLLVTTSGEQGSQFVTMINDRGGGFTRSETGVRLSGDFLQGIAEWSTVEAAPQIALSWHRQGFGVELLSRSTATTGQSGWKLQKISDFSQDEALSAGDLDGDGDEDLFLGTTWLRNDGDTWSLFTVEQTDDPPDRNVLADIDGDGDLDAVVGFQAISRRGSVVWYERPEDPAGLWRRHEIAQIIGPMSLDVADIDSDGDLDVVAGEHNLDDPESAGLWVFENQDGHGMMWKSRHIHSGDEHHDGTQAVDIDLDGDLDLVSIGWGHGKVLWYENRMPRCDNGRSAPEIAGDDRK